ncbi:MAG: alpha/beta fold hydrolase [Flavobacteriaceae bacterium]|nr:alpha/beta fold hydrolase [Flavobacteriaceae bacterium]
MLKQVRSTLCVFYIISFILLGFSIQSALSKAQSLQAHTNPAEDHKSNLLPEQSTLFPFKRQYINVTDYFTEDNLKFDAKTNPRGIFTSDDDDISTYSDVEARKELIALNTQHKRSLISYVDVGKPDADPIILFHGIPTSSFEWREIIPILAEHGRVIAFDQLGQGYSSKHRSLTYTYKQQLAYTEAFFAALGLDQEKVTIVATDTGGSLGFAYAMRQPEKIKGLAFFETVFGPAPSLAAMTAQAQQFRSTEGNQKIITENTFIENLIVNSSEIVPPNEVPFSIRPFTEEEIRGYKHPYLNHDHRRALAQWVLEIPITDGAPDGFGNTNIEIWGKFAMYLMTSSVPKLYLFADPGMLNQSPVVDFVLENFNTEGSLRWTNLGLGYHFLQEDYPDQVGKEITDWFLNLP